MPTELSVDLHDLRILVKSLVTNSVESRAHRLLRQNQSLTNRDVAKQYFAAYKAALPQARKDLKPQYRELLNSLRTGNNIRQTLARFAAREVQSLSESDN